MPSSKAATESEILAALRKRHARTGASGVPEWAFFTHVRDGAGFSAGRTIDALAMNLWQSRGLVIHGFEVKCSRNDWQRELKDPAKAEAGARYCNYWWLVVPKPHEDIVHDGELPHGWGLMAVSPRGVSVVAQAPERTCMEPDRSFVAVLLKRAQEGSALASELQDARAEGHRAGYEKAASEVSRDVAARERDQLLKAVEEFEQGLGVPIRPHFALAREHMEKLAEVGYASPKEIGKAISRLVAEQREHDSVRAALTRMGREAASVIQHVEKALEP